MQYDVVIIGGLGHVGLPLGLMWADAGLTVGAYDLDRKKAELVKAGKMPFIEYGAEPVLARVVGKTFLIPDDISCVSQAKCVLITIGTPVDQYLKPQLGVMSKLATDLAKHLRDGQHIILRSTVYPGTTERLRDIFVEKGLRLHVSYCPERIVQGYAVQELKELPHVISSYTDEGREYCTQLFRKLGEKIVTVGVKEAELTKLYANAWRYITFAVANQFYMMAEDCGADVKEIYRGLTENYRRGQHIPKPGFAAGPCLLKDTLQLNAFNLNHFQLGIAAMQVNEGLPAFCVEHIRKAHSLPGKKIGLLGMSFKAEVDDIRDSLAYKLRKLFLYYGAEVLCTDEYIPSEQFLPLEQVLAEADLFVIGVPHTRYQQLKFPDGKPVFNIWNMDSCSDF
jgi:UDP-N-acetyl-D-mannosaminuronic acid dehydrogenase